MLRRIHEVVGGLMYALNFFIVSYDDARKVIRFLYFADAIDPYLAQPDLELTIDELPNSLTVALLHAGRPLQGPSEQLRRQLGVELDTRHGPDSADWMGVPMWRDGAVSGAIVVQSYDKPGMYSDEDRALLEYVAQHIQTALDRKHAQVELERRVYERTVELQQANLVLQAPGFFQRHDPCLRARRRERCRHRGPRQRQPGSGRRLGRAPPWTRNDRDPRFLFVPVGRDRETGVGFLVRSGNVAAQAARRVREQFRVRVLGGREAVARLGIAPAHHDL